MPVRLDPSPAYDVAVTCPLLALKVKFEPVFRAKSPVAPVAKTGKQVVSLLSSAN